MSFAYVPEYLQCQDAYPLSQNLPLQDEVFHDPDVENFFSNPAPLLLQVSIFLSEDPEYYKTLVATPESGLFIDKLMSIFIEYMEQDQSIPLEVRRSKSFHIRALFFAGGLVSLYLQWFRGQLDCTLFDIPLEVSQLFTKDQSGIMLNMMGK